MTDPSDPERPVEGDADLTPPSLQDDPGEPGSGEAVAGESAQADGGPSSETPSSRSPTPEQAGGAAGAADHPPAKAEPSLRRSTRRADAGPSTTPSDIAELPYVDDPVSKWWVALIVAVFIVLFVWAVFLADALGDLFAGSGEAEPSVGPSPAVSLTPGPTEPAPDEGSPAIATPGASEPASPAPPTPAESTAAPTPAASGGTATSTSGTPTAPAATGALASPAG
jgi:hypothetical protein